MSLTTTEWALHESHYYQVGPPGDKGLSEGGGDTCPLAQLQTHEGVRSLFSCPQCQEGK